MAVPVVVVINIMVKILPLGFSYIFDPEHLLSSIYRNAVMKILREIDPEGIKLRRKRRLKR